MLSKLSPSSSMSFCCCTSLSHLLNVRDFGELQFELLAEMASVLVVVVITMASLLASSSVRSKVK